MGNTLDYRSANSLVLWYMSVKENPRQLALCRSVDHASFGRVKAMPAWTIYLKRTSSGNESRYCTRSSFSAFVSCKLRQVVAL